MGTYFWGFSPQCDQRRMQKDRQTKMRDYVIEKGFE